MIPGFSDTIKQKAAQLGFHDCGIVSAQPLVHDANLLQQWLAQGFNANMAYMANHFEKRANPALLVDQTKSIIVVLASYYPKTANRFKDVVEPRLVSVVEPSIAKYAWGTDYHYVLKEKLNQLLTYLKTLNPEIEGRAFVDSAPVMERALARKAGLGWIGKNSLLVSRRHGSFTFIGTLFVNIELDYNTPINEYCGTCQRCIDACPTQAIVAPKVVDANKCISYHTIESKADNIPSEIARNQNGWMFGCDSCQDVCPWNRNASPLLFPEFESNTQLLNLKLSDWNTMTSGEFKRRFKSSPLLRASLKGIKRNIAQLKQGKTNS